MLRIFWLLMFLCCGRVLAEMRAFALNYVGAEEIYAQIKIYLHVDETVSFVQNSVIIDADATRLQEFAGIIKSLDVAPVLFNLHVQKLFIGDFPQNNNIVITTNALPHKTRFMLRNNDQVVFTDDLIVKGNQSVFWAKNEDDKVFHQYAEQDKMQDVFAVKLYNNNQDMVSLLVKRNTQVVMQSAVKLNEWVMIYTSVHGYALWLLLEQNAVVAEDS